MQHQLEDFTKYLMSVEVQKDAKTEDGEPRRITVGLMTVGSVDSDGEIVDQQSAALAMPAYMKAGGPVLLNHDSGGAPGRCIEYELVHRVGVGWMPTTKPEETDAIRVTTEYGRGYKFPTLWYGQVSVDDVWEQVRQRMMATHSIGFKGWRKSDHETAEEAPRVFVDRIFEYSVVVVPMQQEAAMAVQLMKAAGFNGCEHCRDHLVRRLGEWGKRVPHQQSKVIMETIRQSESGRDEDLFELAKAIRDAARIWEK